MLTFKTWLEVLAKDIENPKRSRLIDHDNYRIKDVEGWKVYFSSQMKSGHNFDSVITKDVSLLSKVLKTVNEMGIRIRIPIVIIYTDLPLSGSHGNYGENIALIYRQIGDSNINVQRVIVHEITHAIFGELPQADKDVIRKMAYELPSPSNYANPTLNLTPSHKIGNEWFAEVVSIIMFKNKGILSWFKNCYNRLRYKKDNLQQLTSFIKKPEN